MLIYAGGYSVDCAPVSRNETETGVFPSLPRLDGVRVLVVDDEPDARRLMKRFLEIRGASVLTAANAQEALETLADEVPDVVLSDIGMPVQDGYDFIRHVRRLAPEEGGDVPAAAVTAFTRADDRRRALLSGFDLHLPKPVDPMQLLTAVARLAGRV